MTNMKAYGPDFYNITDLLTSEELLVQQTTHEFVKNEFMPLIQDHHDNGTFPFELIPKLASLASLVPPYLKNQVELV